MATERPREQDSPAHAPVRRASVVACASFVHHVTPRRHSVRRWSVSEGR